MVILVTSSAFLIATEVVTLLIDENGSAELHASRGWSYC
jgi:hypothetical protein